jgi:hypothetical protein
MRKNEDSEDEIGIMRGPAIGNLAVEMTSRIH